jgi:NAD-dependent deacetylase sirtuin 5
MDEVSSLLLEKENIVFLTGAGLSAASGIPTFRGAGGFWKSAGNEN